MQENKNKLGGAMKKIILWGMLISGINLFAKYETMYEMKKPKTYEWGVIYSPKNNTKDKGLYVYEVSNDKNKRYFKDIIKQIEGDFLNVITHEKKLGIEFLIVEKGESIIYLRNMGNKTLLFSASKTMPSSLFKSYIKYLDINDVLKITDKINLNNVSQYL